MFGAEPWEEIGGSSWSHWDLWFCAVAVADHGASLDQLEERLVSELADRNGGREGTESKLSHLADLRVRLDDAGLVPGGLATPEVLSERGLLAKARKKLAERYLEDRAKTPAMFETPRVRMERRAPRVNLKLILRGAQHPDGSRPSLKILGGSTTGSAQR